MNAYRFWYWVLVCLRLMLLVFGFGYIHPDEFFQSPSITSGVILKVQSDTPWEFQSSALHPPQRSIIAPMFTTGLPFLALRFLNQSFPSNAYGHYYSLLMILLPRLWLLLLSLACDFIVGNIIRSYFAVSGDSKDAVAAKWKCQSIFSLLWPILVFHTRPFSNTMESMILITCFGHVFLTFNSAHERLKCLILGLLVSLGCFTRFTFPIYILPLCYYCVFIRGFARKQNHWIMHLCPRFSSKIVLNILDFLIGFSFATTICIIIDTLYFYAHDDSHWKSSNFHWIVTPLNNFLYNMDVKNLAQHTLHPRYLHILVNFPLLYGPIALWSIYHILSKLGSVFIYSKYGSSDENSKFALYFVSIATAVGALLGLSIAPHQEPRFLIPLSAPITFIFIIGTRAFNRNLGKAGSQRFERLSVYNGWKFFILTSIIHSLIMSLFFAVFHQGGVLPSLSYIQSKAYQDSVATSRFATLEPRHYIYFHTYMPPKYLAALPIENGNLDTHILDLKGESLEKLETTIDLIMSQRGKQGYGEIYVMAPSSFSVEMAKGMKRYTTSKVYSFWPHLSTENIPHIDTSSMSSILFSFTLDLYKLKDIKSHDDN